MTDNSVVEDRKCFGCGSSFQGKTPMAMYCEGCLDEYRKTDDYRKRFDEQGSPRISLFKQLAQKMWLPGSFR
jgi:hypothetical protein